MLLQVSSNQMFASHYQCGHAKMTYQFDWFLKGSGIYPASERKQSLHASTLIGNIIDGEIVQLSFFKASKKGRIRGAPHVFTTSLHVSMFALLEENTR